MPNQPTDKKDYLQKVKDAYFAKTTPTEQERMLGGAYFIATILAVSFFGFFAISPTISTISELLKQKQDTEALKVAMEEKIDNIGKLKNQFDLMQSKLQLVTAAIPYSSQIPTLTRKLETIAKNQGTTLTQVSFGSIELYPANKKSPSQYVFTFNAGLKGNREQISAFIADLANFDRLVSIDSIDQDTKDPSNQSVTISGKAYFNR